MESNTDKKEAIRKFKERKPLVGAYAVRCTANGRVWVGTSRNLEATRNGVWFCLRTGSYIDKSLQAEWNAHGEPAFQYEILETLDGDLHPLAVNDMLKERSTHWMTQLSARPLP
jgi:hypothetical protein